MTFEASGNVWKRTNRDRINLVQLRVQKRGITACTAQNGAVMDFLNIYTRKK